jgi:hypothetical protein
MLYTRYELVRARFFGAEAPQNDALLGRAFAGEAPTAQVQSSCLPRVSGSCVAINVASRNEAAHR